MSEILSHDEKQVVLYSKGHFVISNEIDDLRTITAEAFDISLTSTEKYHVYGYVVKIFLKLQTEKYIEASMHDFICGLFTWETPVIQPSDMIRKMMSYISTVKAAGLDLGEADPKYLPVKGLSE